MKLSKNTDSAYGKALKIITNQSIIVYVLNILYRPYTYLKS